ncbi:hypothetical protein [Rhizobium redzepovicii]|uniref:hypothetical protein n=1 Tax=Rhizobium redzepovicii TaxID=2867518 RepID=UPI002870C037|nr:hypothetical protein [Rhizobium redzepovicii]MDR9782111.1 hypothetical protein [Rhizobium redzepovicii]
MSDAVPAQGWIHPQSLDIRDRIQFIQIGVLFQSFLDDIPVVHENPIADRSMVAPLVEDIAPTYAK